jgi:hypothetical protein
LHVKIQCKLKHFPITQATHAKSLCTMLLQVATIGDSFSLLFFFGFKYVLSNVDNPCMPCLWWMRWRFKKWMPCFMEIKVYTNITKGWLRHDDRVYLGLFEGLHQNMDKALSTRNMCIDLKFFRTCWRKVVPFWKKRFPKKSVISMETWHVNQRIHV